MPTGLAVNSVFLTGGTGFVGRNLLRRIAPARFHCLLALTRSQPSEPQDTLPPQLTFLRGDLFDIEKHLRELAAVDAVVHLAAVTGKARPADYHRINVEGTRTLIECCRHAGVQRFLYISSIAARFPNKSEYPYARSKQLAEEIVRASGLRYAILRPTMVLGRGSPAWNALLQLARWPLIPIPGDGTAHIQPIYIDDLADFILMLLERDVFRGETLEVGGPEAVSIDDFLRRIHLLLHHRIPRTLHIPLAPVLPALSVLEKLVLPLVPFTVGQLSTFRYDGTAQPNVLFENCRSRLKNIDEILGLLCSHAAP